MKRVDKKFGLKLLTAALLFGAVTASFAQSGGNWVIKRDDKIDSPIFKQRPMIAHQEMAPAVEQGYFAERYAAALQDYQSKIRRQWPNAEVSSATRWVSYSDDFKTRRVVDFKSNHMEISVETPYKNGQSDIAALKHAISDQVKSLLSLHVDEALQQDPVAVAIADAFYEQGAESGSEASSPLVFSELFASEQPEINAIDATTERMMQHARVRFQALSASTEAVPVFDKNRVTYLVPMPEARLRLKALQYRAAVKRHAEKAGVPVDMVMATIHAESQFNPLARSHVPAFGLMQIVPSTVGRAAAAALFSNPKLFSPNYLLNAENNIALGTAYLGELFNNKLAAIKNEESRWYFVQAVYKVGIQQASSLFDGASQPEKAMTAINGLSSQQVLQRLTQQGAPSPLPEYLAQLRQHRNQYKTL